MTNLPPDCTQDDIDRAFGGVVTCCECRKTFAAYSDSEDCQNNWTCRRCAVAIDRQDIDNDE